MSYIPHTQAEREAMLEAIGLARLDDLYEDVPEALRFPDLRLPGPVSEMEILDELRQLGEQNANAHEYAIFLGAGAYHHYIPSVVDHLLRRNEFYTAYTPYQPEVSQGTLQAIFEYQSMICHLTGMEVSNASVYDGATALAEAVSTSLSHHRGKRKKIVLSGTVHQQYHDVVTTYMRGEKVRIDVSASLTDTQQELISLLDEDTAVVAVQYPDFLGQVDDFTALGEAAHQVGAWLCVVANPLALGLLTPPSKFGADVVVGEGQPLGIPLSFGGPYLGFFATREAFVRRMPGRLVGETEDNHGQRGYVLTLTPREQHIRREKATSNICTNQGLMMLAATVYLSAMGKQGLRRVAELCYHKAHYAAEAIDALPGYRLWNAGPFFHEFVVETPVPVAGLNTYLLDHGVIGGYDLGTAYPELEGHMLIAVTERNSRAQIDDFVALLEEAPGA